jgi:predicted CXXCH cytochrome family protein
MSGAASLLRALRAGVVAALFFGCMGASGAEQLRYVGAAVCAQCHAAQADAWKKSHHWLAMQPASRSGAVLAPFQGESFTTAGVTSTFHQDKGRFVVRTDGADGKLRDFEVTQVLGTWPLQQYLAPMPDGSLHALDLAWDARARTAGGQRWMQLPTGASPGQPRADWHWTGSRMNANFMCIECHVTDYRKNFDAVSRRYASRWSEGNVGCEACHGAGSGHVDWARALGTGRERLDDLRKGLALSFDERRGVSWSIDPSTGNARRSGPVVSVHKEVEVCARCHSHRSRLGDEAGPSGPLMDTFLPSLAEPGLYWPDGQMRAEVYNYGSFLQSRMHGQGVTCSNCHDPHTSKLRAPGNAVCFQCHAPAKYEAKTHHFHPLGSAGAQCVSCHMPTTTYMSVDPRHDHFIRVPQPELSQSIGTPDACTQCHQDKPRSWVVEWSRRWYPHLKERRAPLASALSALSDDDIRAVRKLADVIEDSRESAFARASALQAFPADAGPSWWAKAARTLRDDSPLVRRAAVHALREADGNAQVRWLSPLLDDPVRAVRIEAARSLAPLRDAVPDRQHLDAALADYERSQHYNADLPESYENLGTLWMDLGAWPRAETALKQAVLLAPRSATAKLNLADFYRSTGREAQCERAIREVLMREPNHAAALHALGLSLLRQRRAAEALAALRKASELDPRNARFAFVYGVALDSAGQSRDAMRVLQAAAASHPRNLDVLKALLAIARRLGEGALEQRYSMELQRAVAER